MMGFNLILRIALLSSCLIPRVMAGFMSVFVTATTQCENATVTWSGDEGPWHLLLTPTNIVQHGYNLWVPEIPSNATNWTIPINQPSGMQFMITMWGTSGIRYAGTTNVLTVNDPIRNSSCFLTDDQILSLYTFSFNISDISGGYPPQCSNLSMTWPTSLENNVTGQYNRRRASTTRRHSLQSYDTRELDLFPDELYKRQIKADTPSSSDNRYGNTTKPPTMFGIIPLGNSFNIPITFPTNYSNVLPSEFISSNPTTWTQRGITHLNWTIPLAKGTRFILVAGIGDDKQWASGGSSTMLTVGQGNENCVGNADSGNSNNGGKPDNNDIPSITSNGPSSTASPLPADSGDGNNSRPIIGTVIACVLSVVGTLIVVGLLFWCYKVRRRRNLAQLQADQQYADRKLFGKNGSTSPSSSDTPLEVLSPARDRTENYQPRSPIYQDDPSSSSASHQPFTNINTNTSDSFDPSPTKGGGGGFIPNYSETWNTNASSSSRTPISPIGGQLNRIRTDTAMMRGTSQEALLRRSDISTNSGSGTPISSPINPTNHPGMILRGQGGQGVMNQYEQEDLSDLKLETLAQFGGSSPGPGENDSTGVAGVGSGSSRRVLAGRRQQEEDLEYVVHQDAGRVLRSPIEDERRVLELPPRYHELRWEEGDNPASPSSPTGTMGAGIPSNDGHQPRSPDR